MKVIKENPITIVELKQEVEKSMEELDNEQKKRLKKINENFSNPIG